MEHFEDLVIGGKRRFGGYEVTREEMLEFARKYDPQPFHLSDEAAAKTHYRADRGERLAHQCDGDGDARPEYEGIPAGGPRWRRHRRIALAEACLSRRYAHCESELLEKTRSRSKPNMGSGRIQVTAFTSMASR